MRTVNFKMSLPAVFLAACCTLMAEELPAVPIGAAKVDITPDYAVRLSGYGARRSESAGVAQKLWARAAAIGGDDGDGPAVIVSVENCGMTSEIRSAVSAKLKEKAGVRDERLVISVTHTHSAPCLTNWAPYLFGEDIPPDHQERIDRYTGELTDKIVAAALAALANRRDGRLFVARGNVGFAANRRVIKDGSWSGFGVQADGPVDHSLPLLVAKDTDGKLISVIANYACHCTTLGGDFNQICGDWAGYAADYIEEDHDGAVALTTIGCGADANPEPRGGVDVCQKHGRALADEVARLLKADLEPIDSRPECRLLSIDLPFDKLPTRDEWVERAKGSGAPGYHARKFLQRLDKGEKIPTTLPYPVASWTFGDDLAMVFLGGEVVVDYAIRLKDEFDADRLWITAYANTVPCYIPSRRILREGGYEADYSMIYYARPTRVAESTEQLIIDAVQKLLPQRFYSPQKQVDFPPPKSPEESLAAIKAPGMKVELVAAEPLIVDPVALDWGPDGRLWVVEMRDYPNGMGWQQEGDPLGEPGGRIKVLEDTDGDGQYDKATVFLDKLAFPTGVKVWRKGILITAAPEIIYAEDLDGDNRADRRLTLYQGFGEGNQQHRVNGLRWGLDNWLHVGNGDSGGSIKSIKTGEVVNVSGRDLRIRPDQGMLETTSGQTQYGRCRDDWDNWFGGNNSDPMWHYVLDDRYLRRNPHFAPPSVRKQVPVEPGAAPVYPISRTLARFNDFDRANRFTSACSPIIYRDELLSGRTDWQSVPTEEGRVEKPADDGRVTNPSYSLSFVCEPVHNLVHREIVTPQGVTFTSRRLDEERESEFLASTDNWFRPAMVRTGPDGALWIADMYRFVIEHPKWIPQDWQRKLDMRAGDTMGRIYRVFPEGTKPRPMPRLDKLDTDGLVAALDSPNGWQRDMAQQMLLWKNDKSAVAPLEAIAASAERAATRLHALCTLDGLNALRPEDLLRAFKDKHPGVRRHAVRLSEPFIAQADAHDDIRVALLQLCADDDPIVRLQLAYSTGANAIPLSGRLLAILAREGSRDPYMAAAILSSVRADNVGHVLECLSPAVREDASNPFFERLIGVAAAMGNERSLELIVKQVVRDDHGRYAAWQFATIAALIDACQRQKVQLDRRLDDKARGELVRLLDAARKVASSSDSPDGDRMAALRLLARGPDHRSDDLQTLGKLLGLRNSPAIQAAAIDALGRLGGAAAAEQLLADWDSHTPAVRSQVLDQMLGRVDWTSELLAAVESQRIAAAHIDARRRNQLLAHTSDEIRSRAETIFAGATNQDRHKVIEQYQDTLTLAGDVDRGKEVFAKRCAVCHRLDEVGHIVGPDLAALTDKSPQAMLVAVLDPNRAVEDKFLDYIAITDDGRQLTGIIVAETGTSITLRGNEGKEIVVLRNEIEELRTSGKSLMPDGMEKDLTKQDLADVIAYLRGTGPPPNEFPGNKPEIVRANSDGTLHLSAANAKIYGPRLVFEEKYRNLGWWASPQDRAVWSVEIPRAGSYRVTLDYSSHIDASGDKFLLMIADESLRGTVEGTGTWDDYVQKEIGTVQLPAGAADLTFRSDGPIKSALIDLRGIVLEPID